MSKQELTNKEANIINAIATVCMDFSGELDASVAQWEVKSESDFDGRAYSALIGQLKRKGLVVVWEERINGKQEKMISLTDAGIALVAGEEEATQTEEGTPAQIAQVQQIAEVLEDWSGINGSCPHDEAGLTLKEAAALEAAGLAYVEEDMVNGSYKVYMVSLTDKAITMHLESIMICGEDAANLSEEELDHLIDANDINVGSSKVDAVNEWAAVEERKQTGLLDQDGNPTDDDDPTPGGGVAPQQAGSCDQPAPSQGLAPLSPAKKTSKPAKAEPTLEELGIKLKSADVVFYSYMLKSIKNEVKCGQPTGRTLVLMSGLDCGWTPYYIHTQKGDWAIIKMDGSTSKRGISEYYNKPSYDLVNTKNWKHIATAEPGMKYRACIKWMIAKIDELEAAQAAQVVTQEEAQSGQQPVHILDIDANTGNTILPTHKKFKSKPVQVACNKHDQQQGIVAEINLDGGFFTPGEEHGWNIALPWGDRVFFGTWADVLEQASWLLRGDAADTFRLEQQESCDRPIQCPTCDDMGVVDTDEDTTINCPDCDNPNAPFYGAGEQQSTYKPTPGQPVDLDAFYASLPLMVDADICPWAE